GKVNLAASNAQHPRASSAAGQSDAASTRGLLAMLAMLLLLVVLVGGIYYAAVLSQQSEPKPNEVAVNSAKTSSPPTSNKPTKPAGGDADKGPSETKKAEGDGVAKQTASSVKPAEMPDVAPPPPKEKVNNEVAAATAPSEPLGLYSERTRPDREKWVAQVGGTPVSEQGVAAGLEWLARHQAEDGHWGPDCLGPNGSRCEKEHPCGGARGAAYEAALTGLAVLAFQAGGNYDFNGKPYSENVRRGLDWLVERQGPNGEIVGSLNLLPKAPGEPVRYDQRFMYEHSIATFALGEACAVARAVERHPNEKYLAAAVKAVEFIEKQQHNDGGWRYTTELSNPSDASVSGWAMLALKTAKEAELPLHDTTLSRMTAFYKRLADPLTGRTHYQGTSFVTDATTGVGMMVDEFIRHEPDSEFVKLGASFLADEAELDWGTTSKRPGDFYLWYNCTLAMFMAGGDTWDRWNKVIRDHILSLQIHGDQCERGSWEPNDQWGGSGGRVYTTALGVLTLEVYYRFAREAAAKPEEKPK
ncbi:MAG: hypothetical protein ACREHD_12515, partial [Pirellulales bacterium]